MNKQKIKIGIDIDLTLVPSDVAWKKWLIKHFPQISEIPEVDVDYNLGVYFGESPVGLNKMDFWCNNHLYDEIEVFPEALDAIKAFKEAGFDIGFISHTKSGHYKSKFRMLKRIPYLDFDNGDSFIATKEKGFLSGSIDVMIDDRNKFLNQFFWETVKIKFETPYTQCEQDIKYYDLKTKHWKEIKEFVLDYFK